MCEMERKRSLFLSAGAALAFGSACKGTGDDECEYTPLRMYSVSAENVASQVNGSGEREGRDDAM